VLAKKLRELRVSAILDIHDLKAHERHAFVRKFFDALMQVSREHWNPALVILDEAHLFAPEQSKAESTASVIDIATRGRKRGLALVAATQRLSKLHKDVAAELLNKLVGRTGLDVDVRRAGDELGMTARDAMSSLRDLQPGEFFAFGPALTRTVTKLSVKDTRQREPVMLTRLAHSPPVVRLREPPGLQGCEGLLSVTVEGVKEVAGRHAFLRLFCCGLFQEGCKQRLNLRFAEGIGNLAFGF
jgi:hypothetical protein